MPLHVLNPVYEVDSSEVGQATAIPSLEDMTVGLLDNNKKNATHFLNYVEEILRDQYRVKDVMRTLKYNLSAPAPDDVMSRLVTCDAVITAIGD